ncbi:MAG TPA: hypothetical protein DEO84_12535 [candidate division Zixibacteria bacterium]|nr:hypothetical protein [candidate division Zixibacteria bacterium]
MKVILKAGIIALVFIGAIMILLFLKGDSLSGKKIHKMIFLENAYDWQGCAVKSCRFEGNSVILLNASEPAELATQPISSGFPFDELILSWNASEPDSLEALEFNVEVSSDKKDWYNFAYQIWGAAIEGKWHNSGKVEYEGIGKMHTDYLVLDKPMNYARVNVRALGESGARDIELRRLSLSFSSKNSTWKQANINTEKAPSFECVKLAVPYFSQRNLPPEISGSCCSPTSVSMVLDYYEKNIDSEKFARLAYDSRGQIYGNWPHNMAAAYLCGMGKTWVESHSSFDEIYNEVRWGKPVIISIAYGLNELPHSPIREAPEGHLICVIGFNGPDTVICNDPAGHNVEDGVINYPRHELEKIWITHGGIAYHLWPN